MSSGLDTKQAVNGDTTPLFWNRMLRFSIYFTIFGVGLGFILGKLVINAISEAAAAEANKVKVEVVDADGNLVSEPDLSPSEILGLPKEQVAHDDTTSKTLGEPQSPKIYMFVAPFFVVGVISILGCLYMRKRERQARVDMLKS